MFSTVLIYGTLFLGNTYFTFGTVSVFESLFTTLSGLFMYWFYYFCKMQRNEEDAFIQWLDTHLDKVDEHFAYYEDRKIDRETVIVQYQVFTSFLVFATKSFSRYYFLDEPLRQLPKFLYRCDSIIRLVVYPLWSNWHHSKHQH